MTCGCTQRDGGNGIEMFKQKVDGINEFTESLKNADIKELSYIIRDHVSFGNNKLPDKVAIFNLGSAKDCPNYRTESCQAYDSDTDTDHCYARKAENQYPQVIDYRRRQQIIWNYVNVTDFANAFVKMVERKHKDVSFLRFNEAGDFRKQRDIYKAEAIAQIIEQETDIETYTYTASDELDFSICDYVTVNASNDNIKGDDQQFTCVESEQDIPEGSYICPQDCSICHACMSDGGSDEIFEILH